MTPRILIVSFSVCPAPDHLGVGLRHLLKTLGSRYLVDVLTLRVGDLPFVERLGRARMLRVPVGNGPLPTQIDGFRRAIRRQVEGEEYETVHLCCAWGARSLLQAIGKATPLVYEVARSTDGEPQAADPALGAELREEESASFARAALILVDSEVARRHLEAQGLGHRVELVRPGVDIDRFDWQTGADAASDAVPTVLYVGHVSARRGLRLLVQTIGGILREHRVRLRLVGPVDPLFRPILEQAASDAGLGKDDMEVLGAVDHADMPRIYAQATLCVAPSAADPERRPLASVPAKILESLACRRPLVAPRRAIVEELVRDRTDGLLFAPADPTDLQETLSRLLADAPLRERLAASGYERVRTGHPASAVRRQLLELYQRLLPASSSSWAPPAQVPDGIDALPADPDGTTAKKRAPWPSSSALLSTWEEPAAEIPTPELPVPSTKR